MFGKKKAEPRLCPEGHPQEETWETCPFCTAVQMPVPSGSPNGAEPVVPPETPADLAPADPGKGAVVVPNNTPEKPALAGWLVALGGEDEGRDFRLSRGENVVGKGSKADIVVRDPRLSERHALVDCREDGVTVRDLESKHGTFLGDERIVGPRSIEDGDVLRLAGIELKFRVFE